MNEDEEESSVLYKTSCPKCGSSDANAVYDDGHTYCFSCNTRGKGDGDDDYQPRSKGASMTDSSLISGDYEPIPSRKLDEEVCKKYGYQVGKFNGKKCHIAPYKDASGKTIAQKVRLPGKDFLVLGKINKALPLFGQHLCREGGKMIVVTEGEIDAMAVTQSMGLNWPAVSVPKGAPSAHKAIAQALEFLESYDKVVFLYDNDEPGIEATERCAALLSPGKAYVASIPLKDAGEMVKAGRSRELVDACWGASKWSADVLNDLDELIDDAVAEAEWGKPWPWRGLTDRTYGKRRGALYTWGAGTGSGKSTLVKQLALCVMRPDLGDDHSDIMDMPAPAPVGTILYEEPAKHTLRTLGGMAMGIRAHVPGVEYDKEELRREIGTFSHLLKSISLRGARNWDTVKSTIRYLKEAEDCYEFIIDPMTALTAGDENERQTLDGIMSELAELAEELHITIHLVFHLATPEGKSHEDGGRVQEKHFRGSRAVAFWSHYLIGLERNKQDPDCPTVLRGLKDRLTGDAVGPLMALRYDRDTGLMMETELPSNDEDDSGFKDETDEL